MLKSLKNICEFAFLVKTAIIVLGGIFVIKDFKLLLPSSYVPSVFDIRYAKLYQNGIRYAVFDVDRTILPFDNIDVSKKEIELFDYIKNEVGIKPCLCSTGSEKRVAPVGYMLDIPYKARIFKPTAPFEIVQSVLSKDCTPYNTIYVGDSFYLDMLFASRFDLYTILVDPIEDGFNFKAKVLDILDLAISFNSFKQSVIKAKAFSNGSSPVKSISTTFKISKTSLLEPLFKNSIYFSTKPSFSSIISFTIQIAEIRPVAYLYT